MPTTQLHGVMADDETQLPGDIAGLEDQCEVLKQWVGEMGSNGSYAVALPHVSYLREETAKSRDRPLGDNPTNKELRFAWYRRMAYHLGYIERNPFPDEVREVINARWADQVEG